MRDEATPKYRSTLQVTTASEVGTVPTIWALPGLLPCHHVSTILAPTGVGLTQLAIQICAHLAPAQPGTPSATTSAPDEAPASFVADLSGKSVSDPDISNLESQFSNRSRPLPEQTEVYEDQPIPAVLFIGGREAPETRRARLTNAGADLRRILILTEATDTDTAYGDEIKRPLKVSDYKLIGEVLHEHKGIRLVIIDNAEDLFFDTNRIKRNRLLRQLACFRALAESREVNVCLLANIPRLDNDPFRTTLLSTLHEVCRTVHLLIPDLPPKQQSDDQSLDTTSPHRLLFTIKNTLVRTCPTLRLELFGPSPATLIDNQQSIVPNLTYPQYLIATRTAAQRRGPKPVKLDYACQVLIHLLKNGPLRVGNYKKPLMGTLAKLTEEAGVAWNTAQRAMLTLNVTAFQFKNRWYWQLPDTIPQAYQQPAQQLAQETSLSDLQNHAQPQEAQPVEEGRATHEDRADLADCERKEPATTADVTHEPAEPAQEGDHMPLELIQSPSDIAAKAAA